MNPKANKYFEGYNFSLNVEALNQTLEFLNL